jgi:hypothetical protein
LGPTLKTSFRVGIVFELDQAYLDRWSPKCRLRLFGLSICFQALILLPLTICILAEQLPNPAITASARAFSPDYTAANLFDYADQEYATAGQDAISAPFTKNVNDGTWVELDFGQTVEFDRFVMRSRVNPADRVGESRLIVSDDPVFNSSDQIFSFDPSGSNGAGLVQNLFSNAKGRYVRWEVISSIGWSPNLGAEQFWFLKTPSGQSLLPAPRVINSSPAYNNNYRAALAVDGDFGTEYASRGAGASMFMDFDFGAARRISAFEFLNRYGDRVTTYDLVFANSPDFIRPVKSLRFTANPQARTVNSASFDPVPARYVRFQAIAFEASANTGIREIQFFTPAVSVPIITENPAGRTLFEGDSFAFSAAVIGSNPLSFQWLKGGASIPGATNTLLFFPYVQFSDAGAYQFVARSSGGSSTSSPTANLVVLPSPELLANGHFEQGNQDFSSDYAFAPNIEKGYSLSYNPRDDHGQTFFGDHTSGHGLMMIVNGSSNTNDVVWSENVSAEPNTTYIFSGWGSSWGHFPGDDFDPAPARLGIYINGIRVGSGQAAPKNAEWQNFSALWNSGSAPAAQIELRLDNGDLLGNDPVFDDFSFQKYATPMDCPPPGLVAWWRAENNALDSVGGHHGVLYRGTSFAPGIAGQAFQFDGVDDAIAIPDSPDFQFEGSFSIQTWIYINAYPGPQNSVGWSQIFFRGDDRPGIDPIFMGIQTDGRLHFEIDGDTESAALVRSLPLHQWLQLTGTLDDSNDQMSLYLNGQLVSRRITSVRPAKNLVSNIPGGIGIGNNAGVPSSGYNMPFNGLIDEVRVFSRALGADEISQNFISRGDSPQLRIARSDNTIEITWPACGAEWSLETTAQLVPSQWQPIVAGIENAGGNFRFRQAPSKDAMYFRLQRVD